MMDAMMAEEGGSVIGFMCATDWECELGSAAGGSRVFASLEDAKDNLRCAEGCGIVKVKVTFCEMAMMGSKGFDLEEPGT